MATRLVNKDYPGMFGDLGRLMREGTQSPEVRQITLQALSRGGNEIAAIYGWVKENVKYVPDPAIPGELFISPVRMAKNHQEGKLLAGDCDDQGILLVAMAGSAGYDARLVIADTDFDLAYDHAFAQVFSDSLQEWISLDTTAEFPLGWKLPMGRAVYVQ